MITKGPIVAPQNNGFGLKNIAYINAVNEPLKLSADMVTFYGRNLTSTSTLSFSTNVDTLSTPTWTDIFTFPVVNGSQLRNFIELPNGEALASCDETTNPTGTNLSLVYQSTGWNFGVGRLTATWELVHTTIGGKIAPHYCFHDSAFGKNGVMMFSEEGTQTTGGAGNQAADVRKARRVWSYNYNTNVATLIFDIYEYGATQGFQYPATVHIHGVGYDEDWDRYWICYGDGNGNGKDIAGLGNTMIVYMDGLKAWTGLNGSDWIKLPLPKNWTNAAPNQSQTQQWICPLITPKAIVFTPDTVEPKRQWVYPKMGYRKLGAPAVATRYRGTSSQGGAVNGMVTRTRKDSKHPIFYTGVQGGLTQTGVERAIIPVSDSDGLNHSMISEFLPLQSPVLTSVGYTAIFGPTINGKIVGKAAHYINNTPANRTMVADLIDYSYAKSPVGGVAQAQNGTLIPHGLPFAPSKVEIKQTVANRQAFVSAVDETNITVGLRDLAGTAIAVNESVRWSAAL
ncbi:hypothetical protein ACFQ2T_04930 [Methylophilus flavus]|uniref:Uncharacterized protein n=1 Tax=Methylophilus flavus TaxID=640084 RepID=A0ABW3P8U3_9PROT